MDWLRDLALLLTAVGGTVLIPKLLSKIGAAITGGPQRARREIDRVRAENEALRADAEKARRERDDEAQTRRVALEHASTMRRLAIEAPCIDAESIPPWPVQNRSKEDTP